MATAIPVEDFKSDNQDLIKLKIMRVRILIKRVGITLGSWALTAFLLLAILVSHTNTATAQVGTELQFNQVLLQKYTGSATPYSSPIYTVPAGMVWKLESARSAADVKIKTLDGTTMGVIISSSSAGHYLPIWLPENTTIVFESTNSPFATYISIIEFTVL